jgi:hypothetical protein
MPKIIERWLLFKYIESEFTPLSKPFKTKDQAEEARSKLPERERRGVAVGVIRASARLVVQIRARVYVDSVLLLKSCVAVGMKKPVRSAM